MHYEIYGQDGRQAQDPEGFYVGQGRRRGNVRRVEPRNTPTMINAVFNHRNFWDMRAQNLFNGVNPFGDRDPDAFVYSAANPLSPQRVQVLLDNCEPRVAGGRARRRTGSRCRPTGGRSPTSAGA